MLREQPTRLFIESEWARRADVLDEDSEIWVTCEHPTQQSGIAHFAVEAGAASGIGARPFPQADRD